MQGCTGAAAVRARRMTVAVAVGEENMAAAVGEENMAADVGEERIDAAAAAHVKSSGEKARGVEKGWRPCVACCCW